MVHHWCTLQSRPCAQTNRSYWQLQLVLIRRSLEFAKKKRPQRFILLIRHFAISFGGVRCFNTHGIDLSATQNAFTRLGHRCRILTSTNRCILNAERTFFFCYSFAPLIVFSVYIFSCHLNSALVFYITSINYTKAASNRIQGKKR